MMMYYLKEMEQAVSVEMCDDQTQKVRLTFV